jgi:hypothetical protein
MRKPIAALAHLIVAATLTCGVIAVAPRATGENICGAHALCPSDPDLGSGDQLSAEQAIINGYLSTQSGCGAAAPPTPGSIAWDPPGFISNIGGSGVFNDPNAPLVDRFRAAYTDGSWNIEFLGLGSCVGAGPDTTGEVT